MKVTIDSKMCTGHARCEALAPDVFELDDNGYSLPQHNNDVPLQYEAQALAAMRACPERAITISD